MAPAIAKAPKEAKPKKTTRTTAAPKKPRAHPTYYEMINEAITALKERTGSSQVAIAKFIEEKQKANLPVNFKKLLLVQLKKLVANGKLVKVKNSFKLPPKSSSATTATAAKKSKAPSTKAAPQKTKSSSTTTAPKKTKPASAKAGAKKPKPASTTAAKKRKAADAGVAAKKAKTDGKKAVAAAKVKKPKTIKSPAKKVVAKKAKK